MPFLLPTMPTTTVILGQGKPITGQVKQEIKRTPGRPKGSRSIGWRAKERGGSWLGIVRVPGQNREECKSFANAMDAKKWARKRHADLAAGVAFAARRGKGDTETLKTDYLVDLKARGRSEIHMHEVGRVLGLLVTAVPDLAAQAAPVDIERWLNEATAKNARATRNRWLVTVRGLARWALRRRRLERDPTDTLERASVPEYLRPQFTVDEMRKCLIKCEWKCVRPGNEKRDPYHLLFAVLAYTGLRFQEAAHLRWEDIDWSGRVIMVRLAAGGKIKRQRERLVPLQAELADIMEPLKQDEGHIFKGHEWNPTRGFANFVKRAGVAIDGRTPHSLRHSYAGMMTATGLPGAMVGTYLGHTSAATTMIYTKLSTRYVASVVGWGRGDLKIMNPHPRFTTDQAGSSQSVVDCGAPTMVLSVALLTVTEAAQMYRMNPSDVLDLCRLGKLKHVVRKGLGPAETLIDAKDAARVLGCG